MIRSVKLIILLIFINSNKCTSQHRMRVELNMHDSIVSCKRKKIDFELFIFNSSKRSIKIPDPIILLNDDPLADVTYIIEKFNYEVNRFEKFRLFIELMPYREIKYQSLKPKSKFNKRFSLLCQFSDTGYYRIYIKLNFFRDKKNLPSLISNKVPFRVTVPFSAFSYADVNVPVRLPVPVLSPDPEG